MSPTKRGTLAKRTADTVRRLAGPPGHRHRRPRAAVRGRRPRGVRRQRRRPAAACRRQGRPAGHQVGPLPRADRPRARTPGSAACWRSRCPRRCGWAATTTVVAYPTVDRTALREPRDGITLMVDCREHLDLIDGGRVCLDVDAGWWPLGGRVRIGAKRSPLRTPEQAAALAREIAARGLELDGLMMYEAQIAGVGDRPANRAARRGAAGHAARVGARAGGPPRRRGGRPAAAALRQRRRHRLGAGHGRRAGGHRGGGGLRPVRADAVRRLHELHAPPRRVLRAAGGAPPRGAAWPPCSAAATPPPARPAATASPAPSSRPACGSTARRAPARSRRRCHGADLPIGDRVWFRHAKAGELCERFDVLHLVRGRPRGRTVPTYRGEGRTFL